MTQYESPERPTGNPAVVTLSDGPVLVLADGTVCRPRISEYPDGDELPCVAPGEGIYGFADEGPQVEFGLPTDDGIAEHPQVMESLRAFGMLPPSSVANARLHSLVERLRLECSIRLELGATRYGPGAWRRDGDNLASASRSKLDDALDGDGDQMQDLADAVNYALMAVARDGVGGE